MLIAERQQRLLELLRQRQAAELEDLAAALDVSGSTVRRDLATLEQQGQVRRTHGGAIYTGDASAGSLTTSGLNVALAIRMQERADAKRAIGAVAAALVEPGMTLLLDGGSTVILAAQQIHARPLQVVTNSLSIAQLFKDDEQVELMVAGGTLYPRTEVMLGPTTRQTLQTLHADLLLFSLAGIFGDDAFNLNERMARVEAVMMQQATRRVMLMDAQKFGRRSLVRVCGIDDVDQIITDGHIANPWRERLGERLTVAE